MECSENSNMAWRFIVTSRYRITNLETCLVANIYWWRRLRGCTTWFNRQRGDMSRCSATTLRKTWTTTTSPLPGPSPSSSCLLFRVRQFSQFGPKGRLQRSAVGKSFFKGLEIQFAEGWRHRVGDGLAHSIRSEQLRDSRKESHHD